MLVHFVQGAYTSGLTEQKWRITYTRTFTGGKAHTCWKTRYFGPRYLVRGIWSKVLTLGIWS